MTYHDIPWHTHTHIYIYIYICMYVCMTYYDYVGLFQNHLWCHPLLVPSSSSKTHGDHVVCDLFHLWWRKIRNLWKFWKWQGSWVIKLRPTGIYGEYIELNWVIYTVSSPTYNWGVTFRHLITTISFELFHTVKRNIYRKRGIPSGNLLHNYGKSSCY